MTDRRRLPTVLFVAASLLVSAGCSGGGGGGGGGMAPAPAPAPAPGGTSGTGGTAGPGTGQAPQAVAATLALSTPSSGQTGDIAVEMTVTHPASAPVDVSMEISVDSGKSYVPATPASGASASGLPSSPAGSTSRFLWSSAADLAATDQRFVRLRATPTGPAAGSPVETGVFEVKNAAQGSVLTRYPYVQRVSSIAAAVLWHTGVPQLGAVEYGATPALGQVIAESAPRAQHQVELANLTPGQTCYYRVIGDAGRLTPIEQFRVPGDSTQQKVRFAIVGDSGHGNAVQYRIADLMRQADPDFYIHVGDVVYTYGSAGDYPPKFFSPYRDNARRAPFFPSLGNHDILTLLGDPYLSAFEVFRNNPAQSERYYSFEWGPARFVAVDTSVGFILPGSAQHRWLIDELGRQGPWTWSFAFHHHPPYSSGNHGSSTLVRYALSPLYEQNGLDIVFTGHDHCYERTKPMKDFASGGRGVVYLVSGGGGAGLYDVGTSSFTEVSAKAHHFVLVEIDGRTLTATTIKDDGSTIDQFTITK